MKFDAVTTMKFILMYMNLILLTLPSNKALFHKACNQWQMPEIYDKSADSQSQVGISVPYINYFIVIDVS